MCNIIRAAEYRFGNHKIFIEEGPLEGWPEAWFLLGYGKVRTAQFSNKAAAGVSPLERVLTYSDLLCHSITTRDGNASTEGIIASFSASNIPPR